MGYGKRGIRNLSNTDYRFSDAVDNLLWLAFLLACVIFLSLIAYGVYEESTNKTPWTEKCRLRCSEVNAGAIAGTDGKCYCVLR